MKRVGMLAFALSLYFSMPASYACSAVLMPLLQLVELGTTDYIVSFRVTGYEDRADGFPRYMDGEVTRQWRGEIAEASIRVYGGDGLSCLPYVTNFTQNQEWLLPISKSDGIYRLAGFTPLISVTDNILTGFISTLNCPTGDDGDLFCTDLSPDQYTEAQSEQMSLAEFERALKLHSNGVTLGLKLCEGPSVRCGAVRPSFNPETGVLDIPSVDILSEPFTYGVSATMQLIEGSETTFEVSNVE